MSLETVVEDIRDEAEAEAAEIRADADEEAERIVAEAEEDAEEIIAAAEREAEQQVAREREQRLSSASLEAKQKRLSARRDVLSDVRERVADRLAELSGERREELTRELVDVGVEEFAGEEVTIHGRAEDRDLLEDIAGDYEAVTVGEAVECLGGVVLESDASRVRVNSTFDSILEDVWEDNLKEISERLFEQ